jgi:site-specific recombinase XerD
MIFVTPAPLGFAQAGVPLAQIRDLLGHSTIKVTERYAHLAPENARGAVEALEP